MKYTTMKYLMSEIITNIISISGAISLTKDKKYRNLNHSKMERKASITLFLMIGMSTNTIAKISVPLKAMIKTSTIVHIRVSAMMPSFLVWFTKKYRLIMFEMNIMATMKVLHPIMTL